MSILIFLFVLTLIIGNIYISNIILGIIFITLIIIFFWYIYEENQICINNMRILDKKLYNFICSKNLIFKRNYKPNKTIISINPCFNFFDFRADFYIEAILNDVLLYSINLTLVDENLHKLYLGGYVCFVTKKSYTNNFMFVKNKGTLSNSIGEYSYVIYKQQSLEVYLYSKTKVIDNSYKIFLDLVAFLAKRFDDFSLIVLSTGFVLLSLPGYAFFLPVANKKMYADKYEAQLNNDYNDLEKLAKLMP